MKEARYIVLPNGVLKYSVSRFNYEVSGFREKPNSHQFDEPTWIYPKDILPIKEFSTGDFNPFSGTQLFIRRQQDSVRRRYN